LSPSASTGQVVPVEHTTELSFKYLQQDMQNQLGFVSGQLCA